MEWYKNRPETFFGFCAGVLLFSVAQIGYGLAVVVGLIGIFVLVGTFIAFISQ